MDKMLFTSESVTCGHPDKVCDQVADKILDELLAQDPDSRVACEVTCAENQMHIFGEITSEAKVNYRAVAQQVIAEIGYTKPGRGFDADTCAITVDLSSPSPDIARGITRSREAEQLDAGAGDQGMMFGYACKQTKTLMPLPIELAHELSKQLETVRRTGELPFLLPDGKSQVTVEYDGDRPIRIASVLVSAQHQEEVSTEAVRAEVRRHVMEAVLPAELLDENTQFYVNPDRTVCVRRPGGRFRSDRTQADRRYLRRICPTRRRCLFRKGCHQGGSQRCIYGALHRQEYRGTGFGRPM